MPLDARIPLGATVAQIPNPLETIGNALKLKRQKADDEAAIAERERKTKEEADERDLFQKHKKADGTPDYDTIINRLSPLHPERAMALRNTLADARTKAANARRSELLTESTRVDMAANALKAVKTPEQYAAALRLVHEADPEMAAALGDTYDPVKVQQAVDAGMSLSEYNTQHAKAIDLALSGKVDAAVGRVLSLAYD